MDLTGLPDLTTAAGHVLALLEVLGRRDGILIHGGKHLPPCAASSFDRERPGNPDQRAGHDDQANDEE